MKFSVWGSTTSYMSRNLPAIVKKKLHHASRTGMEKRIRGIEIGRLVRSKVELCEKMGYKEGSLSSPTLYCFSLCVRDATCAILYAF